VDKKPEIVIWVEAYWEKRVETNYDMKRVCECEYSGGWNIVKCPGFPEINGGYGSPDFTDTPDSLRKMFVDRYSNHFKGGNSVKVKLKITKDERNPTMESFF